jgi:hypothetical protein
LGIDDNDLSVSNIVMDSGSGITYVCTYTRRKMPGLLGDILETFGNFGEFLRNLFKKLFGNILGTL